MRGALRMAAHCYRPVWLLSGVVLAFLAVLLGLPGPAVGQGLVGVRDWTFVIGPLGAILSIPLTLLVRALVLEGDPDARWLRWLSGDGSAVDRVRA